MKTANALSVFGGALLAAAGMMVCETPAQAAQPTPAKIAFDFEAAGTKHAAGEYTFEKLGDFGAMTMRDAQGHRICFLAKQIGNFNAAAEPRLVFQSRGNGYVLAEVWLSQGVGGATVPVKAAKTITVAMAR